MAHKICIWRGDYMRKLHFGIPGLKLGAKIVIGAVIVVAMTTSGVVFAAYQSARVRVGAGAGPLGTRAWVNHAPRRARLSVRRGRR